MIQIMRAQKLSEHLDKLRAVVSRYEQGQLDFAALALAWLSGAETLLREERLAEATDVLTARTSVLAAKDRAQEQGKTGGGKRRAEALAAVDAIRVAETLLRERLLAIEADIDRYEGKLVEAVTALVLLGALPPMAGVGRNAWTQQVWSALVAQQSTRPTVTWLTAALSAPDRLFLLDRILMRLRSSELPVLTWAREEHEPTEEVN
jgi:hypothetical protein